MLSYFVCVGNAALNSGGGGGGGGFYGGGGGYDYGMTVLINVCACERALLIYEDLLLISINSKIK